MFGRELSFQGPPTCVRSSPIFAWTLKSNVSFVGGKPGGKEGSLAVGHFSSKYKLIEGEASAFDFLRLRVLCF